MRNLEKLIWQNGDVQRNVSKNTNVWINWRLINKLSLTIEVLVEKLGTKYPQHLIKLASGEEKEIPVDILSEGDILYACVNIQGRHPLLLPYTIRNVWKMITFGAITYSSDGGHNEVQASNWDLRGIWIHNKMFAPLNIYYKGRLAAQIGSYNGTTYLGGGASTIYFDNDREGFKFGDEISFSLSVPGMEQKRMKVILNDIECLSIFVGEVSGGIWGPNPDFGVYNVNKPSYTGITYYESGKEQYRTYATNPFAPF